MDGIELVCDGLGDAWYSIYYYLDDIGTLFFRSEWWMRGSLHVKIIAETREKINFKLWSLFIRLNNLKTGIIIVLDFGYYLVYNICICNKDVQYM